MTPLTHIIGIYDNDEEKNILESIISVAGFPASEALKKREAADDEEAIYMGFGTGPAHLMTPVISTENPAETKENESEIKEEKHNNRYVNITTIEGYQQFLDGINGVAKHDASVFKAYSSLFIENVETEIMRRMHLSGTPYIKKACWPDKKPIAACITHDIDAVDHVPKASASPVKRLIYELKKHTGRTMDTDYIHEIMNKEIKSGIKATYFFLPHYDKKQDHAVKRMAELKEEGFEIGLHAMPGSHIDGNQLEEEIKAIEKMSGSNIGGMRRHTLAFKTPQTWKILEDSSMEYDASMAFNEFFGFRAGMAHPYFPYTSRNSNKILELPTSFMDWTALSGELNYEEMCDVSSRLIDEIEKRKGIFIAIFHNQYFDDNRYLYIGDLMDHTIMLLKEKGAWFATASEVISWWKKRNSIELMVKQSSGGVEVSSNSIIQVIVHRLPDTSSDEACSLSNEEYFRLAKTELIEISGTPKMFRL